MPPARSPYRSDLIHVVPGERQLIQHTYHVQKEAMMTTHDQAIEQALLLSPESHMLLRIAAQNHLLKELPRTGWVTRGVPRAESVAAHSHGVAVWCLWLAQRHTANHTDNTPVDLGRVLAMATLHDLPEAATGDWMPSQKAIVFGPDKNAQKQAIQKAEGRFWAHLGALDNDEDPLQAHTQSTVAQWRSLWSEYREGQSIEARIVKQADALDCVMQAILYRQLHKAPLAAFERLIEKAAGEDQALLDALRNLWKEAST